eukprot:7395737-Lingulodinium_polyedra.AAC.1
MSIAFLAQIRAPIVRVLTIMLPNYAGPGKLLRRCDRIAGVPKGCFSNQRVVSLYLPRAAFVRSKFKYFCKP